MKIFYDSQIFTTQPYGGISNYFVQLIEQASKSGNDICLPIMQTDNVHLHECTYLKNKLIEKGDFKKPGLHWYTNKKFRGKKFLEVALESAGLVKSNRGLCIDYLKNGDFDIVHPTYYSPYFLDYLNGKPFVITVYDMIHEILSENFPQNVTTVHKKKVVEKASRIITISESTKIDLHKIFGVPEKKITVVHLATSIHKVNTTGIEVAVPEKFLLFTGQRDNHKNFERLLKAYKKVTEKDSEVYLVCTANKFTKNELELIRKLKITDKVIHIFSNSQTLKILYGKAIAFVFPSLYEGFGLPVLEAFACGCPAVLSNTSSLPEVGKDAAVYFDPYSEDSIEDAISTVLRDYELQIKLKNAGFKRVNDFSWEETTRKTIEVYNDIFTPLQKK